MLKVRMCQTAFPLQMWTHASVCISGFTSLFTVQAPLPVSRGSGTFKRMQKTDRQTHLSGDVMCSLVCWISAICRRRLWLIIKISHSSSSMKILLSVWQRMDLLVEVMFFFETTKLLWSSPEGYLRVLQQRLWRRYLPHLLQLLLLVLIGCLQLLHLLLQVFHLHLLLLPQLFAPEPGFTVGRQQPQTQLLDAGLNGWKAAGRETQQLQVMFSILDLLGCGGYRAEKTPWIHSCFFFLSEALISKLLSLHLMTNKHFLASLSATDWRRERTHTSIQERDQADKDWMQTWRFRSESEPFRPQSRPGLSYPHSTSIPGLVEDQTTNGCTLLTSTQ